MEIVHLKSDCRRLGVVISRDEFIKLDPGEVYDRLLCCGAEAVIFRHDDTGHVAVEDANSVYIDKNDENVGNADIEPRGGMCPDYREVKAA